MSTPVPTTTGPGSTSFAVWITTLLAGIASAVEGVVTPGSTAHTAVYGGGGVLIALGGTLAKLYHDKGLHVATIVAAGSDIAEQLPQLKTDLASTVSFIEQDVPGLKSDVSNVQQRLALAETKVASTIAAIPGAAEIEAAVRAELVKLLGTSAPVAPAPAPVVVEPVTVAPVAPPA